MKVSKEVAEQYLIAFKALESACDMISLLDSNFKKLKEFGDFKVGDIYIDLDSKKYYPKSPKEWYFVIESIFCGYSGRLSSIKQISVKFYPLYSKRVSFTEKYIGYMDNFKKIRYLKGKCGLFREDKCEFVTVGQQMGGRVEEGIFNVIGFLVDEPLILIYKKRGRLLAVYPNEIKSLQDK